MYERFTDRARKVLQLAQKYAHSKGWGFIFCTHILRGIVQEGTGLGYVVLRNLGVNTDKLVVDLADYEQVPADPKAVFDRPQVGEPSLRLSPRSSDTVKRAITEAQNLNHDYVGIEHLLLGLLHPSTAANSVMRQHGVTLEKAREEILEILGHKVKEVTPKPTPPVLKTYAHHTPDERALSHIRHVRRAFSRLHEELEWRCPKSRELSVALTNLETTAMWAVKAIVCNDPNSKVEGEVSS